MKAVFALTAHGDSQDANLLLRLAERAFIEKNYTQCINFLADFCSANPSGLSRSLHEKDVASPSGVNDGDDDEVQELFATQSSQMDRAFKARVDHEALAKLMVAFYARVMADDRAQAGRYIIVLENLAQGLCLFDSNQRLVMCNRRYAEIYDLNPEDTQPGNPLYNIVERRFIAGSSPEMSPADYLLWRDKILATGDAHDSVVELRNGRVIAIRHQPMPDGGWVSTHEDITDRRKVECELAHAARHDPVTGLPTRATLTEQLDQGLLRCAPTDKSLVLSLSLVGFRAASDTLGRETGDAVLRVVAERLMQNLRPADLVGQANTDEFVVVRYDGAEPSDAAGLANQLASVIAKPIGVSGQAITLGTSIGVAVARAADGDAATLMKNASVARHLARVDARSRFRMFEPHMEQVIQERRRLEADFRTAVQAMTLELHYQPQINLRTRRVTGFEALLRWFHPLHGSVPPSEFIPLAEEIGLIGLIGGWAIKRACLEAMRWPTPITVAVNVSALQLVDAGFRQVVVEALECSGLAPARLELEITESCMVENADAAAKTLGGLRALGVRVSMDDFGTGYSSLGNLPKLPFDKIKIDRSFLSDLGPLPAQTAIIRAILSLSKSLGIACTAEGVETREQLSILVTEECTEAQGYLLGRPTPAKDLDTVIKSYEAADPDHIGPISLPVRDVRAPFLGISAEPNALLAQVVESANDVIVVTSANLDHPGPIILYVNPAFTRLTGYSADEIIGQSPRVLQGPGTSREVLNEIGAGLRAGHDVHQKVLNYTKSGSPYWLDLRIVPLRNLSGDIVRFAAIQRDITQDRRHLDEVEQGADRDALTGIANRRALLRIADAELRLARERACGAPCLGFVDVDNLKLVNDNFGHAVGDAVLVGIANRLSQHTRRIDTIGRIGGDEFVVVMPNCHLNEAINVSERLCAAVSANPFDTPAGPISATVSIGVADAEDEQGLSNIMARADKAMYIGKRAGGNRVTMALDHMSVSGAGDAPR